MTPCIVASCEKWGKLTEMRVVMILFCLPLATDLLSCSIDLRHIKRGRGPSGFGFLSLALYLFLIMYTYALTTWIDKIVLVAIAIAINQTITMWIPRLYMKRAKATSSLDK